MLYTLFTLSDPIWVFQDKSLARDLVVIVNVPLTSPFKVVPFPKNLIFYKIRNNFLKRFLVKFSTRTHQGVNLLHPIQFNPEDRIMWTSLYTFVVVAWKYFYDFLNLSPLPPLFRCLGVFLFRLIARIWSLLNLNFKYSNPPTGLFFCLSFYS